jgi:fibrillarin-like rRNA methylase
VQYFLKNGGNFVISIKASCIDSTATPEAVFAREVRRATAKRLLNCSVGISVLSQQPPLCRRSSLLFAL